VGSQPAGAAAWDCHRSVSGLNRQASNANRRKSIHSKIDKKVDQE
jgi:hypothetical protein